MYFLFKFIVKNVLINKLNEFQHDIPASPARKKVSHANETLSQRNVTKIGILMHVRNKHYALHEYF